MSSRKSLIYEPSKEKPLTKQLRHLLKRLLIGRSTFWIRNIDALFDKLQS